MEKPLAKMIYDILVEESKPVNLKRLYEKIPDRPPHSIRGRLHDHLGKLFDRVAPGVYVAIDEEGNSKTAIIEGDGRDLSFLEDESIDAIITDHPWSDKKSNIGGDRKFTDTYDCFMYKKKDFEEKCRVLKPGGFLVEIIPAENENNYEYLYSIKKIAKEAGLNYYSKVPWKKGSFVSNTGRKAKNTEDVLFFTKGKARKLRPDKKKSKNTGEKCYMSGTSHMLPTNYDINPVPVKKRIHQAEKPVELYKQIIEAVTKPGEVVLDQFSGSGAAGIAALETNRFAVLIEITKENIENILSRLKKHGCLIEEI